MMRETRESWSIGVAEANQELSANPRRAKVSVPHRRFILLWVFAALLVVFYAPYFVPMRPTSAVSYHFGYNNPAATVLLVCVLVISAIWTRGMNISFKRAAGSQPVPQKFLVVSLLAVCLGCLIMYSFAGRFGGFGESSYNIDRAWLLLQGKTPYVDFEWPFGPYFLYVPVFLCHVFSLDIARASYIVWGITFLCGTCLLFGAVNLIDYPTSKKTTIFLLLMTAAYPELISMGTPGALLRHLGGIVAILTMQRIIGPGADKSRIYALLFAVMSTAILLLISPEIAVAYAFACLCIFLLGFRQTRSLGLVAALTGAFAVIFWTANHFHLLDTLRASAGGADSLPVIPAPHILLFFVGLFLCACYVYRRLKDGGPNDNTIGLIAYSVPMLAAALGRCDAPHVFLNGFGVFLACSFYVSNHVVAWKYWRTAFALFMIVIPTITGIWLYTPYFASAFLNTLEESKNSAILNQMEGFAQRYIAPHLSPEKQNKLRARLEKIRHPEKSANGSLRDAYPEWQGEFAAPFGYRPNHLGTALTNQIDYGFYEGTENATTTTAVHRKIGELAREPQRALLLPDGFDDTCLVNAASEKRFMTFLFFCPYLAKPVHTDSVYRPLCDYIHEQYRIEHAASPSNGGYSLWVRKCQFNCGAYAQLSTIETEPVGRPSVSVRVK